MRWVNIILSLGLAAAVVIWGGFVVRRFSPEPAWADASGYFNSASLISKGELAARLRVPAAIRDYYPYDFEPIGFHFDNSRSLLVPTYFVGLPILLAGARLLVGWHLAPFIVILGSAILLLVCSYLILRVIDIEGRLAMAAVVSLAWCPIFVFTSSQTYSDAVASLGCALAALCVLRGSKENVTFALISGASLGFVLLVRSTNCLLLPSLLILSPSWRHRVAVLAGCLPFVGILFFYQKLVYGGALTSGYGDIFRMFGYRYVPGSLEHYAMLLPRLLPISVLAPIGALCATHRWPRRLRLGLVTWIGSFAVFYAFYYFTGGEWTYLRFIEPTFPALLALGCMAIEVLPTRFLSGLPSTQIQSAAAYALLALTGCIVLFAHFADPELHNRGFVAARAWTRQNLPPNALVVCKIFSGSIYFETPNPILRWDITAKDNIRRYLGNMWDSGMPVYSLLDASELSDPELHTKVPGHWEKMANLAPASVWRIERPAIGESTRQ